MDPNQQPALGARLFREWCEANFGPIPLDMEANSRFTLDDIYRKAVEFSTHVPVNMPNGQSRAELEAIEREHFGDPEKSTGIYASRPSGLPVQFLGEEQEPPL